REEVPRDAATFQEELRRAADGQGVPGTPPGQRARKATHRPERRPRPHAATRGEERSGAGAEGSAAAARPKRVGSWGPKRRR
ncbi:MAG TPA: ATP-dependent helicase, partial [Anaeromyxobacter sp.]|nr:ATP-dependent helicase [Anaeromyxobacter sp.]